MFDKYIPYEELKETIESIPNAYHKNFIKLMYCSCARVGEITRNNPTCANNPAVKGEQITFDDTHMFVLLLTEKTHLWRRVPVNRLLEPWITEPLISFALATPGTLFNKSTRWGQLIFQKYFDSQHTHILRKSRATHLLQGKCTKSRLREEHVMKLGGWLDTKSLHKNYSGVIVEDYLELI